MDESKISYKEDKAVLNEGGFPEKKRLNYWDIELEKYNPKGYLSSLINPGEFKKKLETVNLFIAILVTLLVTFIFFF